MNDIGVGYPKRSPRSWIGSLRKRSARAASAPERKLQPTPLDVAISSCAGDLKVKQLEEMLDLFKMDDGAKAMERSDDQKTFHQWFLQANFPTIYGAEWSQHAERVLMEHGLDRVHSEVRSWRILNRVDLPSLCVIRHHFA